MCWHRWSNWSDPLREKVGRDPGGVFLYDYVQVRTCSKCNKKQHNTL